MKNCQDCAHSIFDEQWGEYKCKIVQHRIYNADKYVVCKDYIHKKKLSNGKGKEE